MDFWFVSSKGGMEHLRMALAAWDACRLALLKLHVCSCLLYMSDFSPCRGLLCKRWHSFLSHWQSPCCEFSISLVVLHTISFSFLSLFSWSALNPDRVLCHSLEVVIPHGPCETYWSFCFVHGNTPQFYFSWLPLAFYLFAFWCNSLMLPSELETVCLLNSTLSFFLKSFVLGYCGFQQVCVCVLSLVASLLSANYPVMCRCSCWP